MSQGQLFIAVILNIFIMPGSGHVLIKHKLRGTIFMGLLTAILIIFIVHFNTLVRAQIMMQPSVGGHIDVEQAMKFVMAISRDVVMDNMPWLRFYTFLIGLCYIAGIADLFWLYYDWKEAKG